MTGIALFLLGILLPCVLAATLFNAAFQKAAVQSTTHSHNGKQLVATNAVDDNIGDSISTCSCTKPSDYNPWWRVDLAQPYPVHSVMVRNRDAFGSRLRNFTMWVSTDDTDDGRVCSVHVGSIPNRAVETLVCDQITVGRYVKITQPAFTNDDRLTLCEVQVLVVNKTRTLFEQRINKTIDANFDSEVSVSNAPSCADHCHNTLSCVSFGYKRETGICQLYNSTQVSDGNRDEESIYTIMILP